MLCILGAAKLSLSLALRPSSPYVALRNALRCLSASSYSACSNASMSSRFLFVPDDSHELRLLEGDRSILRRACAADDDVLDDVASGRGPEPNL